MRIDKSLFSSFVESKAKNDDESKWEMIIEARPTTEDVDSYNEITDGKAFMRAMQAYMKDNPVMMYNHQFDNTIGRVLDYWDDNGPVIRGGIAKTERGKEVAELIRMKVISKMSFMFGDTSYVRENSDDNNSPNRLVSFKLYELGPVAIPANMGANIQSAKGSDLDSFLEKFNNDSIKTKEKGDDSKGIGAPAIIGQAKELKMTDKGKKDADALIGDIKTEVEDLATKHKDLEEAQVDHAKRVTLLIEKMDEVSKNVITDGEMQEFSVKIGTELEALQKQIRRIRTATNIQGSKDSVLDWQGRDPVKTPMVFDDAGHAKSEMHQRAYHLFHAPVNYTTGGEAGRTIKQIRQLHDVILFTDAYMRKMSRGNYKITGLKSYGVFKDLVEGFDPQFSKVMASTIAGAGDEWVPTEVSSEFYDAYRLAANLENYIPHWSMPSNPALWPILTTRPKMYRTSEAQTNNPPQMTKSNFGTSKATFTTETYGVCAPVTPEFIEDSIIQVVPALNSLLAVACADGFESMLINGDDSAPHMDTAAAWATDPAYPESYEKGFRKYAIDSSTAFDTQSASAGVGDGTTAFTAEDCRYLRTLLPAAYGHKPEDIVYVVPLYVWMKMLSFEQYSKPGTYGANASWLTGTMNNFDGSEVAISSQFPTTLDAAGKLIGPSTKKGILCINKNAFKIGEKRGVMIEFDKDPYTQLWSFIATMRKSFQPMTSATATACSYGFNIE